MLKEALAYLERGWSIIPIQSKSKTPLVPWAEFHSRLPSKEEVRGWFAQWPNCNIGIVTGKISGLVVVDVDTRKGGNHTKFLNRYPTNLVSQTGGGGFHLFYSYPKDVDHISNAVGFEEGIDLRADGGMIVAPPSLHASGEKYFWLHEGSISLWPEKLTEQVKDRTTNAKGWLSAILEMGAKDGERNEYAAKVAGYCQMIGMSADVAKQFTRLWNTRNTPPLPVDRIDLTIDSVYRTAKRRTENTAVEAKTKTPLSSKFTALKFESFMSTYGGTSDVKWLVDKWLPEATIAFLVSPPGSYKTWLTIDVAISIATGTKFLNAYETQAGPVLFIQQEDYNGQTAQRFAVVAKSRFGLSVVGNDEEVTFNAPPEIPVYIHTERAFRFDNPGVMRDFEKLVSEIKPKLVVLDPLYSAATTDDYMASVAEYLLFFKTLRDKYGTSFLIAHHTKKAGGQDRERDKIWGSQFLNAALETGWQISPQTQESIRVNRHFKATSPVPDTYIKFNISTLGENWMYEVEERSSSFKREKKAKDDEPEKTEPVKMTLEEKIVNYFLSCGNEPISISSLAYKVDLNKGYVYRVLKELLQSGKAQVNEEKKWSLKQ